MEPSSVPLSQETKLHSSQGVSHLAQWKQGARGLKSRCSSNLSGIWAKSLSVCLSVLDPLSPPKQRLKIQRLTANRSVCRIWEGQGFQLLFSSTQYTVGAQSKLKDMNQATVTHLLLTVAKRANSCGRIFGYFGIVEIQT